MHASHFDIKNKFLYTRNSEFSFLQQIKYEGSGEMPECVVSRYLTEPQPHFYIYML